MEKPNLKVIDSDVFKVLEKFDDPEYIEAKRIIDALFSTRAQRINAYLVIAAERKMEDYWRVENLIEKIHKKIAEDIGKASVEELYELLRLSLEVSNKQAEAMAKVVERFQVEKP